MEMAGRSLQLSCEQSGNSFTTKSKHCSEPAELRACPLTPVESLTWLKQYSGRIVCKRLEFHFMAIAAEAPTSERMTAVIVDTTVEAMFIGIGGKVSGS
jgi:hypothetical protein